jgi:hypothetical protein
MRQVRQTLRARYYTRACVKTCVGPHRQGGTAAQWPLVQKAILDKAGKTLKEKESAEGSKNIRKSGLEKSQKPKCIKQLSEKYDFTKVAF